MSGCTRTTTLTILSRQAIRLSLLVVAVCGLASLVVLLSYSSEWIPRKLVRMTQTPLPRQKWEPKIVLDWSGYERDAGKTYLEGDCLVTRDRSLLNRSHAVVITHRKQLSLGSYPQIRRKSQRWVWLIDECPYHTFMGHNFGYSEIRNVFNWTMTYRKASDVYIPYGWTTRREKPEPIPNSIGNRTRLVAAVISNCDLVHNARNSYIRALNSTVRVDGYGACAHNKCKGHTGMTYSFNCAEVKDYLFYLAFENSNCKEYITEKPFSHGFDMGTVPVVMGSAKEDYLAIVPPNSFIYADDFSSPAELGKYLTFLSNNRSEYMKYHEWRKHYTTAYRVHYLTVDPMWESLCRALESDTGETKIYADLETFWDKGNCRLHWK